MRSDYLEASSDGIRNFQAPSVDLVSASSISDTLPENDPSSPVFISEGKTAKGIYDDDAVTFSGKEDKLQNEKPKKANGQSDELLHEDSLNGQEDGPVKDDTTEKSLVHLVNQRLPLMLPEKVQRMKALVECNGDSIDLSGDVGAVGRLVISNDPPGEMGLLLDLKGTIYKSTVVPSRTFCVVNVGQSDAKIEAIMNDFIQLEPQSNMFDAETMVEGKLDGYSFESEEDAVKVSESAGWENVQTNGDGINACMKRNSEKPSGARQKRAKTAEKTSKRAQKRSEAVKRTKRLKK